MALNASSTTEAWPKDERRQGETYEEVKVEFIERAGGVLVKETFDVEAKG